jgi:hypothetical protein
VTFPYTQNFHQGGLFSSREVNEVIWEFQIISFICPHSHTPTPKCPHTQMSPL